jgi:hypothetical protein
MQAHIQSALPEESAPYREQFSVTQLEKRTDIPEAALIQDKSMI